MNLQARLTESLKASQSALRVISQLESRLAEREAELKSVDQYAKEQYRAYDERLAEREKELAEAKAETDLMRSVAKGFEEEVDAAREDLKWAKRTIEEDKILISDYLEARSMAEKLGEALGRLNKWCETKGDWGCVPKLIQSNIKEALSAYSEWKAVKS